MLRLLRVSSERCLRDIRVNVGRDGTSAVVTKCSLAAGIRRGDEYEEAVIGTSGRESVVLVLGSIVGFEM
jgi:hypothetical protein